MIDSLASDTDLNRRNETMVNIWKILQEETVYIPIHIQTLAYDEADLDIPVDISNQPS